MPRTTRSSSPRSPTGRSAPPSERRAEALVAGCSLCAQLHADLVALGAAARAMPTPARPRDYVLTPADAARLRPSGWRRVVAAFGTARDGFSRPLAVGLTTLGLAGLLVTTVPSILPWSSATSGGPSAAQDSIAEASRRAGAVAARPGPGVERARAAGTRRMPRIAGAAERGLLRRHGPFVCRRGAPRRLRRGRLGRVSRRARAPAPTPLPQGATRRRRHEAVRRRHERCRACRRRPQPRVAGGQPALRTPLILVRCRSCSAGLGLFAICAGRARRPRR